MATQEERRTRTRAQILEAATDHFVERGYADTSITDVLDSAGISRGALYHHFSSKEDLFATVFLRTSTDAIRRASAAVPADAGALDALEAACLAWLDISARPEVARILLIDGPSALGWERCRSLEEATSLGGMRAAIRAAVAAGELSVPSVDIAARLINGVLAEAALALQAPARSARAAADRRRNVRRSVSAMIRGFAGPRVNVTPIP